MELVSDEGDGSAWDGMGWGWDGAACDSIVWGVDDHDHSVGMCLGKKSVRRRLLWCFAEVGRSEAMMLSSIL